MAVSIRVSEREPGRRHSINYSALENPEPIVAVIFPIMDFISVEIEAPLHDSVPSVGKKNLSYLCCVNSETHSAPSSVPVVSSGAELTISTLFQAQIP